MASGLYTQRVWNATAVGVAGVSAAVVCADGPFVSAFGNSGAATTLTLQYSDDNVTYYDGPASVLAGASDFRIDATTGARWTRLKSSAAATITAIISAKG